MLLWLLTSIVVAGGGPCIDSWGACTNAGARIDPEG